jgi:hypothetical protein
VISKSQKRHLHGDGGSSSYLVVIVLVNMVSYVHMYSIDLSKLVLLKSQVDEPYWHCSSCKG